jgi:hypothetical protein
MAYLVLKKNWQRHKPFLVLKVSYQVLGKRLSKETYIKKSNVYLVLGGKGSGKTRELLKVQKWADQLFNRNGFYFNVLESMSDFYKRAGLESSDLRGLKSFEKNSLLIEKVKDQVVCIDNVDKASSQKKEVIKDLIRNSGVIFVSAEDLKQIDLSIVKELMIKGNVSYSDNIPTIDLGNDFEIVEVSGILGVVILIVLIVFFQQYWALGVLFVLRYMHRAGKQK